MHGAWHSSWCWKENFVPFFTSRGFRCVTMDLRGHGGSPGADQLRHTKISDYVEDVVQVVGGLEGPPILVAHSMGGYVSQRYCQEHPAAGMVILASVPWGGSGYGFARRHPLTFLKFFLTGNGKVIVENPKIAKDGLFSPDIPEDRFERYFRMLEGESADALLEITRGMGSAKPSALKFPVLVLAGERDRVIPRDRLLATAAIYSTDCRVLPQTAHDAMLETTWKDAAQAILDWCVLNKL